jgi:hypothetical protein
VTTVIIVRTVAIVIAALPAATQPAVATLAAAHIATAGRLHAATQPKIADTALETVATVQK